MTNADDALELAARMRSAGAGGATLVADHFAETVQLTPRAAG